MAGIEIKKVTTKKEWNDFVSLPRVLYKDSDCYVPDLDTDIREMFDARKNRSLAHVEAQPFIAYKDGKAVGRIAGLINRKSNEIWNTSKVRFSLIEFIDDRSVSEALLNAVAQWGSERGMTSIEGPMGMTDYDKEGMLVEDFELEGTFVEIWNPQYYVSHMEAHGYEKEADWVHIRAEVPEEVPARYARVAAYTKEELRLHIAKRTKKEIMGDYGKKVFNLLNSAYAPLFGFAPFSDEEAKDYLKKYVPLLDLDFVVLIENEQEDLVALAITMADISAALRKSRGKMLPMGWWHLLKALKIEKHEKAELMLIAVSPELQGMGVNALVFDHLIPVYNRKGIKWCETGPQLEDNVKELSQWKPLHPQIVKRRRCWKKDITPAE